MMGRMKRRKKYTRQAGRAVGQDPRKFRGVQGPQVMVASSDHFAVDLIQLATELKELLPPLARDTVDRCLDLYNRQEFVIMVAGEISVGKSSFLNAMIGKPILLTDTTETTAAITYLRTAHDVSGNILPGVRKDHVRITYKDGKIEWIPISNRKRLEEVTTSLSGQTKAITRVKKAEVYFSNETLPLPPGITIIDTPGLNGSESHAELTHREMGLCHAALFLLDATKFGTLSNKAEFQRLYRYAPEVLFVINKWDLVRKSGHTLQKMKTEEYFPKLGNWTANGEITDENIFVISGSEAFVAKERYFAKLEKLPTEKRAGLRMQDQLRFPDNEYFSLEGTLQNLFSDTRKASMIRRRPLQTLLQVVNEQQDLLENEKTKFLAADADFERRLNAETMRVQSARDDAERAFSEVRDFARRLASRETECYRKTIQEAAKKLADDFWRKVDSSSPSELASEAGQHDLSTFVDEQVSVLYRQPITKRFQAFVSFIQSQLDTNTVVNTTDGVNTNLPTGSESAEIYEKFGRDKQNLEKQIEASGSLRTQLVAELRDAEKDIKEANEQLALCENERVEYSRLEGLYQNALEKRKALGARPAMKHKTVWATKTVRHSGGLLRKIGSFFGLCDEDTYEEVSYSRTIADDSEGKKWDEKYARLNALVESAKEKRDAAKPDSANERGWQQAKQDAETRLRKANRRLSELDEEAAEKRRKLRQMNDKNVRQMVMVQWKRELERIRDSFGMAVSCFGREIDRLLEEYWKMRSEKVSQSIRDLRQREQELESKRKQSSSEYQRIIESAKRLSRIRNKLEVELNGVNTK